MCRVIAAAYLSPLAPEIGFTRFQALMEWSKSETSDFD
jgi:hypothetical protein